MAETTTIQLHPELKPVEGGVTAAAGFRAAGVHAGLKRKNKDVALVVSEQAAAVAGTFTTNRVKAAPLLVTQEHMEGGIVRAIVINSGNANACTGPQGLETARQTAAYLADKLGIRAQEVLVASTGVIGQQLPLDKLERGIDEALAALDTAGWQDAALAIMTTDTRPKTFAVEFAVQGRTVRLGGMAKGSGMIHPNMATMLAFLTTDLAVEASYLQDAFKRAVDKSFNMISVDGDTSTNDMALVLANGRAGNDPLTADSPDAPLFEEALAAVCTYLAKEIARDGEGATKLVEVQVDGAPSPEAARQVARTISTSNLVKTAIFGEDANWGRILCAAGYSGVDFDPDSASVYIGDVCVAERGVPTDFDEAKAKDVLRRDEVRITVDLGTGEHSATAWTCDMTYDYIKINASYRT